MVTRVFRFPPLDSSSHQGWAAEGSGDWVILSCLADGRPSSPCPVIADFSVGARDLQGHATQELCAQQIGAPRESIDVKLE